MNMCCELRSIILRLDRQLGDPLCAAIQTRSDQVADCHRSDAQSDRQADVEKRTGHGPSHQFKRLQAERREGGVAAAEAAHDKQAPVVRYGKLSDASVVDGSSQPGVFASTRAPMIPESTDPILVQLYDNASDHSQRPCYEKEGQNFAQRFGFEIERSQPRANIASDTHTQQPKWKLRRQGGHGHPCAS